jgi:hypothetical protein
MILDPVLMARVIENDRQRNRRLRYTPEERSAAWARKREQERARQQRRKQTKAAEETNGNTN